MATEIVSADYLRSILAYDADTGVFTRLVRTGPNVKVGDIAGGKNGQGYIQIRVFGRLRQAHRLAWLFVHGAWPVDQIDHIDGNPGNNRIANLRDVSQSVNQQNQRRATSKSTHGFMGATRSLKRWTALITIDGKQRNLGQFDTAAEAHAAYLCAKRLHHVGCTI